MTVQTNTATDHNDLFDRLRTFLTTSTGGGGAGWTELGYDGVARNVFLRAPGLAGDSEIHVGFGVTQDDPTDSYSLRGWMARGWNATFPLTAQPQNSLIRYHPVWDSAIPYWFIANGQRVIIITKISTSYFASYLGKFLPYGVPSDYPQPYYVGMPSDSNARWSVDTYNVHAFFDAGPSSLILQPSGTWFQSINGFESGGDARAGSSGAYVWPFNGSVVTNAPFQRYRELRNNLDGTYPRFALELYGDNPQIDYYGQLDGVYAIPGFSAASEDTVVIDGVTHLLIQDVSRTSRWNYAGFALV